MRTIKYRALDNLGAWIYGIPQTSSTLHITLDRMSQYFTEQRKYGVENVMVIPETLGQFTGITDINGVEIYEGDYLVDRFPINEEDLSEGYNESLLPVVWCEKQLMWCVDASFEKNGSYLISLVEYFGDFLEKKATYTRSRSIKPYVPCLFALRNTKHNVFLMQGIRYEPQNNANHRNRNEINTLLSLRFLLLIF